MNGLVKNYDRVFVPKGWGWEDWIYNGAYCGKILFIKKNKKCSFHYHKIKDEVLYIQSGEIEMVHGKSDNIKLAKRTLMNAGDAFRVMPNLRHQMIALQDTYIFETSTHHEDADSIRVIKGD